MPTPRELDALYKKGVNITQLLRDEKNFQKNTSEMIEIAYDLQAGSYTAGVENEENAKINRGYTQGVVDAILQLCKPESILEAGVGEATTLSDVAANIGSGVRSFGFDLSWSRVAYAKHYLKKNSVSNVTLYTGDIFNIPFADNSIDVVYTSHSMEPNGGHEEALLKELFRVSRKFLILLEPAYELSNEDIRQRMDSHGYCKNLKGTAESLGYDVIEHSLFSAQTTTTNPTAITIIKKDSVTDTIPNPFVCPQP
jgi:ubiquinone/menaquinone biosynthesis C-methylase UbiE